MAPAAQRSALSEGLHSLPKRGELQETHDDRNVIYGENLGDGSGGTGNGRMPPSSFSDPETYFGSMTFGSYGHGHGHLMHNRWNAQNVVCCCGKKTVC